MVAASVAVVTPAKETSGGPAAVLAEVDRVSDGADGMFLDPPEPPLLV